MRVIIHKNGDRPEVITDEEDFKELVVSSRFDEFDRLILYALLSPHTITVDLPEEVSDKIAISAVVDMVLPLRIYSTYRFAGGDQKEVLEFLKIIEDIDNRDIIKSVRSAITGGDCDEICEALREDFVRGVYLVAKKWGGVFVSSVEVTGTGRKIVIHVDPPIAHKKSDPPNGMII